MGWISQALPSSIPFTCAYLYNILQLFLRDGARHQRYEIIPLGCHDGVERSSARKFRYFGRKHFWKIPCLLDG